MTALSSKNENEALEILLTNLDETKTITDEFLAEFAGVRKDNFNRRADQLISMDVIGNFNKVTIENLNNIGHINKKIIRKYSLPDVILVLSQYENSYQRRALKICRLALQKFVNESVQTCTNLMPRNSTIPAPLYAENIFGELVKVGSTTKNILDLSYEDLIEAKLSHIQKIIIGLNKKQKQFSEELLQIKNSKLNKISKVVKELKACGV
nr:hypothetical protein GTC16762_33170 [Pigmentibacter ruber]